MKFSTSLIKKMYIQYYSYFQMYVSFDEFMSIGQYKVSPP